MPLDSQPDIRERYLALEKAGPVALVLLGVVVGVAAAIQLPTFPFALGSMLAGVLVFLSWRAALVRRNVSAFSWALASLVAALLALSSAISEPLPLLVAKGLGLVGFAFFACVLLAQRHSKV